MTWAGRFFGYGYPQTELILRGVLQSFWSLPAPPQALRIGPKLALMFEEVGATLQQKLGCPIRLDPEFGPYEYQFET